MPDGYAFAARLAANHALVHFDRMLVTNGVALGPNHSGSEFVENLKCRLITRERKLALKLDGGLSRDLLWGEDGRPLTAADISGKTYAGAMARGRHMSKEPQRGLRTVKIAGNPDYQVDPCYCISSKRYVLFNAGLSGEVIIRKASAHWLGHYLAPYEADDAPQSILAPSVSLDKVGVERWQRRRRDTA